MYPRSPSAPANPDGDSASSVMRASSNSDRYRAWLTWPMMSASDQRNCARYTFGTAPAPADTAADAVGGNPAVISAGSVTRQLPVRHSVRLGRFDAHPVDLVALVRLEVALEPEPLIRAFVGALP